MKILDVYGTDVSKEVQMRRTKHAAQKARNFIRYERRYYRIAEELARKKWKFLWHKVKIPLKPLIITDAAIASLDKFSFTNSNRTVFV